MHKLKAYFLIFGLIGLSALIIQFVRFPDIIKFLSYFTVLSNALVVWSFLYIGLHDKSISTRVNNILGGSIVYIILSGLGYWLLLAHAGPSSLIPAVNTIIHIIMPVAALLGWLFYTHPNKMNQKNIFQWFIFPFGYLFYILIRGALSGWYPYPFLDPREIGGYGRVMLYTGGFTICLYFVSLFLVWLGNRKAH